MMDICDLPKNNSPLYEKVKQVILEKIEAGEWKAQYKLPGEPVLSRDLKISRMTINRALRELTTAGVLERIPGVGTFVADHIQTPTVVKIHNIADEICSRNQQYRCEVIKLELDETIDSQIEFGMKLKERKEVYHSEILHFADNMPAQLEVRYILKEFAPDYINQDFTKISTSNYLYSIAPPTTAEHIIEASMINETERAFLQMKSNEPALIVTRRTWVEKTLTGYMQMIHPGTRYKFLDRYDFYVNAV